MIPTQFTQDSHEMVVRSQHRNESGKRFRVGHNDENVCGPVENGPKPEKSITSALTARLKRVLNIISIIPRVRLVEEYSKKETEYVKKDETCKLKR